MVVVARSRVLFGKYADLERSFLKQMKQLGMMAPVNEDKA